MEKIVRQDFPITGDGFTTASTVVREIP